jgi:hypothetical protein
LLKDSFKRLPIAQTHLQETYNAQGHYEETYTAQGQFQETSIAHSQVKDTSGGQTLQARDFF